MPPYRPRYALQCMPRRSQGCQRHACDRACKSCSVGARTACCTLSHQQCSVPCVAVPILLAQAKPACTAGGFTGGCPRAPPERRGCRQALPGRPGLVRGHGQPAGQFVGGKAAGRRRGPSAHAPHDCSRWVPILGLAVCKRLEQGMLGDAMPMCVQAAVWQTTCCCCASRQGAVWLLT